MQYVLHITEQCNFACDYCSAPKSMERMDPQIPRQIADAAYLYAKRFGQRSACLSFYGGEPLLYKECIINTIEYVKDAYGSDEVEFHYRMTTNGSLLDGAFIRYAKANGVRLALSVDGTKEVHDMHRKLRSGAPTYDHVVAAARCALQVMPDTPAMATVNPDTAGMLMESVRALYAMGFTTIVTTMNILADWRDEDLHALQRSYHEMADWYEEMLLMGKKIQLPLFDMKWVGLGAPKAEAEKCRPGSQKLSIGVDGTIYPCTQYVGRPEYAMGCASVGVDAEKLRKIRKEAEKGVDSCAECAINARCDNGCGCKNMAATGSVREVSPVVCAHERMLIPIADALGSKLFRRIRA